MTSARYLRKEDKLRRMTRTHFQLRELKATVYSLSELVA